MHITYLEAYGLQAGLWMHVSRDADTVKPVRPEKFKSQKIKILRIMKKNNFKLITKNRNDFYYKNEFDGIYNYIFKKDD